MLLVAGCVDPLPLSGRACPCLSGWRCCPQANQCVRETAVCPGPLALDVEVLSLPILGDHHFSCDEPVSYSVQESQGGSIDADGHYRAPFARALFHVRATSLIDGARTVSVPVTVGPTRLEVYAGAPGGPGNADGAGGDARMGVLDQLVSDDNSRLFFTQSGSILFSQPQPYMVRHVSLGGSVGSTMFGGSSLAWKNGDLYVAGANSIGRNIGLLGLYEMAGLAGVSAYAEGPAMTARFVEITGLAPDGDDGLYVAEKSGAIRRFDLGDLTVSLVAGLHGALSFADGTALDARFHTLGRIAPDGAGGLYIADEGNRRLRHFAAGMVSTAAMLDGDEPVMGMAILPSGALVVTRGNAIFQLSGGALTQWSGERATIGSADGSLGEARYFAPHGMVVVGDTLYVADASNHTVRAVSPLGVVSTLAGTARNDGDNDGALPAARLHGPESLASDGARIYIGEAVEGGRIRGIESGTMTTRLLGFDTVDLAAAADGTLYFSDEDVIYVLPSGDTTPTIFAGQTAGDVDGIGEAARFSSPRGLALSQDHTLYVTDTDNGSIRHIDVGTRAVTTMIRGLNRPSRLALDGESLFISESTQLSVLDLPSKTLRVVASQNDGLVRPGPVVIGRPGEFVYLLDDRRILALRSDGSAQLLVAGDANQIGFLAGPLPSRLNRPNALLRLPDDSLLVSDLLENTIGLIR